MHKRRILAIICFVFSLALIGVGVYLRFFSKEAVETQEGYERQEEEQDLADQYIKYLLEVSNQNGQDDEESGETPSVSFDDFTELIGQDTNYLERDGVTYTPDYAKGYLAFVLDVPSAGIKRGVYSGTWDDIYYDLDIWMVTVARVDYKLGETHMCIYGHNHTAQSLSFNNLKNVKVGEEFYLYAESGYYRYEVTNVTADWRPDVTRNLVDNFSIGSDKCYIITCGRDENRYKDLIVEGTLVEHLTLQEYAQRLYN